MRLLLLLLTATLAAASAFAATSTISEQERLRNEAKVIIKSYAEELQGTVRQTITDSGAPNAVLVCQLLAPVITDKHSSSEWKITRTALRVRNPGNQPDAWERQILERFATAAAQGQSITTLNFADVVDGEFRYMQAIPTQEGCLACHGHTIDPAVKAALDRYYPDDQATGFALGELRGAFSVRHPLDTD
jgi:cytochrome c551/c552